MVQVSLNDSQQTTNYLRNMTGVSEHNETGGSYGEHITSLVDQIWRGAIFLLSTLLPSSKPGSAKGTNIAHQKIEDDYEFIFYFLFGINLLIMLPSWCKHLISTKKKKLHSIRANAIQQEEQITKKDTQSLIHSKLLQTYLPAYLLATCADWLQGPYKYALYSSYGYTQRDIAHLFVAGYGSGMILGSIVGSLADSYGRKRLCLCYCLSYTFSVMMKHCKHFYILLLGRVFGGIATSLLFSVFESWLICAHGERGLGSKSGLKKEEEEKWLAKSLSVSMYGSSLAAIGSGVLANLVVENSGKMRPLNDSGNGESLIYIGGYISAFDACLVPLVLCAALIVVLWEENYGEAAASEYKIEQVSSNCHSIGGREYSAGFVKKHSSVHLEDEGSMEDDKGSMEEDDGSMGEDEKSIRNEECKHLTEKDNKQRKEGMFSTLFSGIRTVWNSPEILICCIIGSVFEGAMYIFIFLWTPALTTLQERLDYSHGNLGDETGIIESTEKDIHTDSELPFGWIFSSFMVCCMLGTIAFSRLSDAGVPASKCLVGILAFASLSCLAMACPYSSGSSGSTSANTPQYLGMLMYEFCIGFYYPAMGTVKGTIVPEDQRAAIYNVFRLPLNLLVLVYLVGDFSTEVSFLANATLLMVACVLQIRIVRSSGVVSNGNDHHCNTD